jgi:hypothetical protein
MALARVLGKPWRMVLTYGEGEMRGLLGLVKGVRAESLFWRVLLGRAAGWMHRTSRGLGLAEGFSSNANTLSELFPPVLRLLSFP